MAADKCQRRSLLLYLICGFDWFAGGDIFSFLNHGENRESELPIGDYNATCTARMPKGIS